MDRPEFVAIGYVKRAHGINGRVLVESLTDNPTRFETLSDVHVEIDGTRRLFRLEKCSAASNGWLVKFEGVDDRNEAESLKGGYLQIETGDLPALEEGSYHVTDLTGVEVYTTSGDLLGTLTEILKYPANDIWIVEGDRGRLMLPAIRNVIKKVDIPGKRMEVELLNGLDFE